MSGIIGSDMVSCWAKSIFISIGLDGAHADSGAVMSYVSWKCLIVCRDWAWDLFYL